MSHEQAFSLVKSICPRQAGWLWNTTQHAGCDTANAVADQYGDDEEAQARRDLRILASGRIPYGWESA